MVESETIRVNFLSHKFVVRGWNHMFFSAWEGPVPPFQSHASLLVRLVEVRVRTLCSGSGKMLIMNLDPSEGSGPAMCMNLVRNVHGIDRGQSIPTPKPPPHAPVYQAVQSRCAAPPSPRHRPSPQGAPYAPRQPADASRHNPDASQHRQLFDHRKHDPISFSAAQETGAKVARRLRIRLFSFLLRPVLVSSIFTLSSSTTDGSSAPSSIFDHKTRDEPKTNAFSNQLN